MARSAVLSRGYPVNGMSFAARPLKGHGDTNWELIYFIANPRELDVPFREFCSLFATRRTSGSDSRTPSKGADTSTRYARSG